MEQEPPPQPRSAWSSGADGNRGSCDERWVDTTTHTGGSDDFVAVSQCGGHSSSNSDESQLPQHRPGQLNYSTNSSSERSLTQGASNVFSPSSPYAHRQGSSGTPTTSTPPTPAPRGLGIKLKQVEEDNSNLRQQMESLRQLNSELQRKLQSRPDPSPGGMDEDTFSLQLRIGQLEDRNEKLKEANSVNVERLTEKIAKLELSNVSSDQEINQFKQQLVVKEREIARERQEKHELEQSLASLKIENERVDEERQILERERDRLKQEIRTTPTSERAPGGALGRSNSVSSRDQSISKRLIDSIREKKQLAEVNK